MPASKEVMEKVAKLLEAARYPESVTSNIERQKQYVAMLHSRKPLCWLCAEPVSFYEAVEDSYSLDDKPSHKFTCPHCKVEMMEIVAIPNPWFWGNPKIYRKGEGG